MEQSEIALPLANHWQGDTRCFAQPIASGSNGSGAGEEGLDDHEVLRPNFEDCVLWSVNSVDPKGVAGGRPTLSVWFISGRSRWGC